MRKVNKLDSQIPSCLLEESALSALENIANTGNKNLISDRIYRDPYTTPDGNLSGVVDALDLSYYHKCAYCERITKADVEHYRPKRGVSEDKNHPGYYWLCYEWTNLIPACITCNREGAKHNSFPILGKRIYSPVFDFTRVLDKVSIKASNPPLIEEIPCLLHPEIDDTELFFEFEVDPKIGIRIVGIDAEGRGNSTIEICKLNRQELRIDRHQQIVLEFVEAVHSAFAELNRGIISEEQFLDRLSDILNFLKKKSEFETFPFTFLRRYVVKSEHNFKKIMFPFLDSGCHRIVMDVFKSIL
jgi:uncharacterized protein (TIGR02646 family)